MSAAPYPLEPDDERRARHLFVLKSLTDRGAALALKIADQAETELAAAAAAPASDEPPSDHHRTFERYVRLVRQLILAEHRIATDTGATRRPYRPAGNAGGNHQAGNAGGNHQAGNADGNRQSADADRLRRSGPNADPRREPLRQHIHKLTRSSPARAQLRREAEASLDEALDRDPALTLPAGCILGEICDEYGLPFDLAHIPDAFLEPPITGPPDHMPR